MHISLSAETLFYIGSFPVSNTLINAFLVSILLIVVLIIGTRKMRLVPKGLQNILEAIIEGLLGLIESVTGNKKQARQFLPIIATIFIFVIICNWSGLLPGVGTIGYYEDAHHEEDVMEVETKELEEAAHGDHTILHEPDEGAHEASMPSDHSEGDLHLTGDDDHDIAATHGSNDSHKDDDGHGEKSLVPFFRAASSDLNFTLALAIISVLAAQIFGIAALGFFKYSKKFINFRGPINFFVGILELIGEISKMISFSFRLFGNVFAGEVLLVVIAFLIPFIAPLPFYFLEVFVGFIQALVFAMLTLVFLKIAATGHEEH